MPGIIVEQCNPDRITACDLRTEIEHTVPAGRSVECYILIETDDAGYRNASAGSLVFFPDVGRAGIEWGGDAEWTDADSAKDALDLYIAGEMRP